MGTEELTGTPATESAKHTGPAKEPGWATLAPPLADGFISRPETGQALQSALVPGSVTVLVPEQADAGPRSWRGSCGKTQLALASARALRQSGAVELVIWLTATSRASVLSGYAESASAIYTASGVETWLAENTESGAARFLGWLRDTDRPWLAVLDDLTAETARDQRLWPTGPAGRVLVTTADPAVLTDRPAQVIPVGPFSRREALNYLVGRLTMDLDQRQGAIDLIGELHYEPLALAQASAVISSSELTCHSYREHFVHRREQATTAHGERASAAAATTWELSMEHADLMSSGPAQPLLVLAALLDGTGIPGAVFTTGAVREYCTGAATGGNQAIMDGLAVLESAGLLSTGGEPDARLVAMSWPVQAAVRAAMPDGMLQGAAVTAANALLAVWPVDGAAEALTARLRSCVDSLRRMAGALLWQGGCHPVLLRAGRSLDAAGLTSPALTYWAELAAASDQALGRSHPATTGLNERLARAYLTGGQAAKAISLLEEIRGERANRLGPDHPGTLELTRGLGQALTAAGRYGDAVAVLTEAAAGWARPSDPSGIGGLEIREDLAAAQLAAGAFAPAIALYQSALAERERLHGPRHVDTTGTRQQLAAAYLASGQAKAAVAQYERVVADRERVLGPGHLHTIAARGALGAAYHSAGRMAAAVRLFEQTRAAYATALGPGHRDTLAVCVNLAHAYYGVGRITDAARLLQETVKRCEAGLPALDQLTATARESLAKISGTGG